MDLSINSYYFFIMITIIMINDYNCHQQLAGFSHESAVSVETPTSSHRRLANLYTEWTGALIG